MGTASSVVQHQAAQARLSSKGADSPSLHPSTRRRSGLHQEGKDADSSPVPASRSRRKQSKQSKQSKRSKASKGSKAVAEGGTESAIAHLTRRRYSAGSSDHRTRGFGSMGTTSSMGSREHKSDIVSVSSSYLTANPDVCMSGFVWMYPPSDGRSLAGSSSKPEVPRRVWLEARTADAQLVWVDVSGDGQQGAVTPATGGGAGAGAGAGGSGYGFTPNEYGADGTAAWWWGAATNSRLNFADIRATYAGKPHSSLVRTHSQTRLVTESGISPTADRGGSKAAQPFAFTVSTYGANIMMQAPNAYEFAGWLAALRTALYDYHHVASGIREAGDGSAGGGAAGGTATSNSSSDPKKAIFRAAADDDTHTMRYLLKGDMALLETANHAGDTPLIAAARAGSSEVLRLLLRRGADVMSMNKDGQTALVAAAGGGHIECIDAIVRRHRRVHGRVDKEDKRARRMSSTAAKLAAHRRSQGAVSTLLDKQGVGGLTAAHTAAAGGHVDALELLLLEGANPFVVDDSGWTVAHYAVNCSRSYECIALLCDVSVEVLGWWDTSGNTPLHVAASSGWTEGVQMLLQAAANPHALNLEGKAPAELAIAASHAAISGLFAEYRDSRGLAPEPTTGGRGGGGETSIDRIMAVWDRFFANALGASMEAELGGGGASGGAGAGAGAGAGGGGGAGAWGGGSSSGGGDYFYGYDATLAKRTPNEPVGRLRDYKGSSTATTAGGFSNAMAAHVASYVSDTTYTYPQGADAGAGAAQDYYWDDATSSYVYYNDTSNGDSNGVPASADASGGAWELYTDDNGESYEYNTETGESRWPSAAAEEPAAAASYADDAESGIADASMTEEWQVHWDIDAGRAYWYNTVTGETAWQEPEEEGQGGGTSAGGGTEEEWAVQEYDYNSHATDSESQWTGAGGGVDDGAATGDTGVWEAAYDDDGNLYYYNHDTQESVWEEPESVKAQRLAAEAAAYYGYAAAGSNSSSSSGGGAAPTNGGRGIAAAWGSIPDMGSSAAKNGSKHQQHQPFRKAATPKVYRTASSVTLASDGDVATTHVAARPRRKPPTPRASIGAVRGARYTGERRPPRRRNSHHRSRSGRNSNSNHGGPGGGGIRTRPAAGAAAGAKTTATAARVGYAPPTPPTPNTAARLEGEVSNWEWRTGNDGRRFQYNTATRKVYRPPDGAPLAGPATGPPATARGSNGHAPSNSKDADEAEPQAGVAAAAVPGPPLPDHSPPMPPTPNTAWQEERNSANWVWKTGADGREFRFNKVTGKVIRPEEGAVGLIGAGAAGSKAPGSSTARSGASSSSSYGGIRLDTSLGKGNGSHQGVRSDAATASASWRGRMAPASTAQSPVTPVPALPPPPAPFTPNTSSAAEAEASNWEWRTDRKGNTFQYNVVTHKVLRAQVQSASMLSRASMLATAQDATSDGKHGDEEWPSGVERGGAGGKHADEEDGEADAPARTYHTDIHTPAAARHNNTRTGSSNASVDTRASARETATAAAEAQGVSAVGELPTPQRLQVLAQVAPPTPPTPGTALRLEGDASNWVWQTDARGARFLYNTATRKVKRTATTQLQPVGRGRQAEEEVYEATVTNGSVGAGGGFVGGAGGGGSEWVCHSTDDGLRYWHNERTGVSEWDVDGVPPGGVVGGGVVS